MKVAFLLLALGTANSANTIRSDRSKLSLLSKSRRIEEAVQDDDQSSLSLANYALKLIGCANGEAYTNPDSETEYGAVIFRLCPADTYDSAKGCKKGYGQGVQEGIRRASSIHGVFRCLGRERTRTNVAVDN